MIEITKKYSSAKEQYKSLEQTINEIEEKLNSPLASFLLKLPICMSYETWKYLHELKGDWID